MAASASGVTAGGTLRVAIAQINLLVGDMAGNAERVIAAAGQARSQGADVVVFPELALSGYPPDDLLLRPDFHEQVARALDAVRQRVVGIVAVIGYPLRQGDAVYNAAAAIRDGDVLGVYHKHLLPNYAVFDEKRYFVAGTAPCVVEIQGVRVGLQVCEDVWGAGAPREAVAAGAELLLVLNASPYHAGKDREREALLRQRVSECGVPMVYTNLIGGQDELVFDGASFVIDAAGCITQRAPAFEVGVYTTDFVRGERLTAVPGTCASPLGDEESVYRALMLGVRDYVDKNGFGGVVIGLSGGIDSALTLAIAADALGANRVEAVSMPSRFTAPMSIEDARAQAEALGVELRVISIEPAYEAFLSSLREEFAGRAPDVTEENIQARCRGVLLMAISNKKRKMVLTTGNKSEMAVGYATLYGDMAGGFDLLKDVPKTLVYRLARYRNALSAVIPERVLERAPTAELAPNQTDQDILPPYPVLDAIIELYIEQDRSIEEIVAAGHDAATVRRVVAMIDRNEYKRRQAPPGVRISRRAFGRDRRYPITSGFNRNRTGGLRS